MNATNWVGQKVDKKALFFPPKQSSKEKHHKTFGSCTHLRWKCLNKFSTWVLCYMLVGSMFIDDILDVNTSIIMSMFIVTLIQHQPWFIPFIYVHNLVYLTNCGFVISITHPLRATRNGHIVVQWLDVIYIIWHLDHP